MWNDSSGKTTYGAAGNRDALIIVSEDGVSHPDVVKRRPAIVLTEEVRGKLENQGISKEHQQDDHSIVRARHKLDQRHEMGQARGEMHTRESVHKCIATLMNNCNTEGGNVRHWEDIHYEHFLQLSFTTLGMGGGTQGTGVSKMASLPLQTWPHSTCSCSVGAS